MAKTQMSPNVEESSVAYLHQASNTMFPREEPQISGSFRGQPDLIASFARVRLCSKECPSKAIEMVKWEEKNTPNSD